MPAVIAIAMAPQTTTRTVARPRGAPPRRAPRSPSSAERDQRHGHGRRRPAPTPASARRRAAAAPRRPRTTAPTPTRPGTAAPAAARRGPARRGACASSAPRRDRASATSLGQRRRQAPLLVDPGELAQLALRVAAQLALLQADVGLLGVALRADRHVLAGGHRQRAGHQPGDPGGDDRGARRAGRGHAEHEARGRHDAVVGAEHGGAQPVGAVAEVDLGSRPALALTRRAPLPRPGARARRAARRRPCRARRAASPAADTPRGARASSTCCRAPAGAPARSARAPDDEQVEVCAARGQLLPRGADRDLGRDVVVELRDDAGEQPLVRWRAPRPRSRPTRCSTRRPARAAPARPRP